LALDFRHLGLMLCLSLSFCDLAFRPDFGLLDLALLLHQHHVIEQLGEAREALTIQVGVERAGEHVARCEHALFPREAKPVSGCLAPLELIGHCGDHRVLGLCLIGKALGVEPARSGFDEGKEGLAILARSLRAVVQRSPVRANGDGSAIDDVWSGLQLSQGRTRRC
jgi:hypothetical protein